MLLTSKEDEQCVDSDTVILSGMGQNCADNVLLNEK
jgi:hypothetical protein